jgi:hypothetical protein
MAAATDAGPSRTGARGRTSLYRDDGFETAHKIALDERCWIEHVPGPADGRRSIHLTPSAGDLIVTGGRTQED